MITLDVSGKMLNALKDQGRSAGPRITHKALGNFDCYAIFSGK